MASEVDIANLALTLLGASRITSLGDDNKAARACKQVYPLVRDAELTAHQWKFAIRRTKLAALNTTPDFEYVFAYQRPIDLLSVIMVGESYPGNTLTNYRTMPEVDYRMEGDQILTNLGAPLAIRYVAKVIDPTQFDGLFVMAVAAKLAETICEEITMSTTKIQLVSANYKDVIRRATQSDSIQAAPEPLPEDSWILARL